MPVATSSRRRSRRQISSDIEEDRPTQASTQDNVEEEEEDIQSRPRTKRVKKESKANIMRQTEPESTDANDYKEDIDGDGDDGRIDVENFHNQPIGKGDLTKLRGISQDWMHMEKKVRQNWSVVGDVAAAMADAAEGDDAETGLAELDIIMKDLIDIGVEMQSHEKTIEDIYQKIGQGEDIDDVVHRYEAGVSTRMKEYNKKTTRQKYAKSEEYAAFKQGIYEAQFPDKAIPPITDFIPKEDGDDSDDDDEPEMGGVTQNYTCPITLTPLVNPVTSEVCGHSFSAEAIRSLFRGSSTAVKKCPASGCNKSFQLTDFKPNKELAKKVKLWERRARMAAENSDAEDIVD